MDFVVGKTVIYSRNTACHRTLHPATAVPPIRNKKDDALWCKKEFSTKKLLHRVDKAMRQTAEVDCLVSSVWINLAPPKVEFFVWLALLVKLNTKHMRLRKGVISDRDLNCIFWWYV